MKSRKRLLKKSLLYLIIDKKTAAKSNPSAIAKRVRKSGVGIIQLRDKLSEKEVIVKDALSLRKLLLDCNILFIVNDYLDVAKIVDADGLHIGQSDTSIELARSILGPDKIIGVSCHDLKQALLAQKRGADYIGIGPIFPTPTKPEYRPIGLKLIGNLRKRMKIPFFVIGDVNLNNLRQILSSGAQRVAVCRAILGSSDVATCAGEFFKVLCQ